MSALLSVLNPSASAAATRAAARADAASDKAADNDGTGSPFADLLGAGPAEGKAAQPARSDTKSDRKGDGKSDSAQQDRDRDDDRAAQAADATPALPAWLQALREPALQPAAAAATAPAMPATGDGDAAAALAALASSLGASRSVKAEAASAPSSASSSAADASVFASALAAADAADPAAALPTPEPLLVDADTALSAAQNLALGNALDALAGKTDLPASLVATLSVDRSTSAITTAPPAVDAGSPLAAGQAQAQAQALDTYGEPLSLDGPDAAVRLGERLRWLSEAGVQEARLQLHPKELGAIDIRIRVEHQTANVWFGADHPAARAALEATLPQLRERLAADGLQLGQAEVGSQSQSQAQGQSKGQGSAGEGQSGAGPWGRTPGGSDERAATVPASERLAAVARHRGLVDRYA